MSVLVCPQCKEALGCQTESLECPQCHQKYPLRNGKVYFVEPPERLDSLDRIKGCLKKALGKYYYVLGVDIIAPDFPFRFESVLKKYNLPGSRIVVDAGSGNRRVHEDIICIDCFDYKEVDIVCDLEQLPFAAESIDAFVSRSVLEHVSLPHKILAEIAQCTRKGGLGLYLIPFLYPFHASPHDFQRLTHKGLQVYFPGWGLVEQRSAAGPMSVLVAGLAEFISLLFGFGNASLQGAVYLLACLILFPIKFLDIVFIPFQRYLSLSLMIFTVLKKPEA